jgi:ParB family chromosome partitioning protein
MRHDRHFVDDLSTRNTPAVGRFVPLASIQPHPGQPRSVVGDLSELVASIREKGVLEPILIRPNPGAEDGSAAFEIISGERRYRAALEAGLYEIPAIEMDVNDQEALEIALVENLQREDLSPFEEADGYRALAERHQYTHEEIAQAVGKSRTAITETLGLLRMPGRVRDCVRALGVANKSVLLELLKLEDEDEMLHLLERISTLGLAREAVRKEVKQARRKAGTGRGRAKPYTFSFNGPEKRYRLSLSFRQSSVEPEDLIAALEEALARLRQELADSEEESIR